MHPRRRFPADFHSGRKEEGRGREARKEGRAGDIVAAITDMGIGTRSPSRRLARRTDGPPGRQRQPPRPEVGINSLSLSLSLSSAGGRGLAQAGGRGRGRRRRQGLTTTRLVGHRSGCRRGGGGGGRGGGDDVRMDAAATGAVHTYRGFEQGGRGGLSSLSNYFPAAQTYRSSRNPF